MQPPSRSSHVFLRSYKYRPLQCSQTPLSTNVQHICQSSLRLHAVSHGISFANPLCLHCGKVRLTRQQATIGGFLTCTCICTYHQLSTPSAQFPRNSPAGLCPHEQVDPATVLFSVVARSQLHSPAGRAPAQINRSVHYSSFL